MNRVSIPLLHFLLYEKFNLHSLLCYPDFILFFDEPFLMEYIQQDFRVEARAGAIWLHQIWSVRVRAKCKVVFGSFLLEGQKRD